MTLSITREIAIRERRSPGNKVLGVALVKNSSLYAPKWEDGGELPDSLKDQRFTSVSLADEAIVSHLNKMWDAHEKQLEAAAEAPKATARASASKGD